MNSEQQGQQNPHFHSHTPSYQIDVNPPYKKVLIDETHPETYTGNNRIISKKVNQYGQMKSSLYEPKFSYQKNREIQSQQEIINDDNVVIDQDFLNQLVYLQSQLQKNPNILKESNYLSEQNQGNSQQHIYVQQIGELEQELEYVKVDREQLLQKLQEMTFYIEKLEKDLDIEEQKENNLKNELDNCQILRDQLEKSKFEISNLENERDFHHKNHTELRRKLFNNTQNDFNLKQLKRDKHFLEQELDAINKKSQIQENQINELMVFALKPRNEKQATSETYFAKQIVDLQQTIKNQKDEIFKLKNFQEYHKKSMSNSIKEQQQSFDNNSIVEDLKVQLEMQKKQNELLNKRLDTLKGSMLNNSRISNQDSVSKYKDVVKKYLNKIKQLEQQLKEQKQEQFSEEKQSGNIRGIILEKEKFEQENLELKNKLRKSNFEGKNSFSEGNSKYLQQKIKNFENLKERLENRIKSLENEVQEKDDEIEVMKQQQAKLINVNQRMEQTINELQDQMKNLESINQSDVNDILKYTDQQILKIILKKKIFVQNKICYQSLNSFLFNVIYQNLLFESLAQFFYFEYRKPSKGSFLFESQSEFC